MRVLPSKAARLLAVASIVALGLTACGRHETTTMTSGEPVAAPTTTIEVTTFTTAALVLDTTTTSASAAAPAPAPSRVSRRVEPAPVTTAAPPPATVAAGPVIQSARATLWPYGHIGTPYSDCGPGGEAGGIGVSAKVVSSVAVAVSMSWTGPFEGTHGPKPLDLLNGSTDSFSARLGVYPVEGTYGDPFSGVPVGTYQIHVMVTDALGRTAARDITFVLPACSA